MPRPPARDPAPSRVATNALLLGGAHALVDAACAFLLFRDVVYGPHETGTVVLLVILYNLVAFGGQAPAGLVADRFRAYRVTGLAGAGLCAAALFLGPLGVLPAVLVMGVGNALFHVGAGALVLASSGTRATESGIFVGPGAVGLAAGIWLGGQAVACRGWIAGLLVVSAIFSLQVSRRWMAERRTLPRIPERGLLLVACLVCLLASVTIRSVVGGTVTGAWRGVSFEVMVYLAVAACAGKMLGGFVADRIGWMKTSVGALAISSLLISVWVDHPASAVSGMLLFQMTMAVTLKATHHALPGRPGFAFGLPCLALLVGALPALLPWDHPFSAWPITLFLIAAAVFLVVAGLRLLTRAGASGGPATTRFASRSPRTGSSARARREPGWERPPAMETSTSG